MNLRFIPIISLLALLCSFTTLRTLALPTEIESPSLSGGSPELQRISDPQGERLAQAYHILAKCDKDYDGHVPKAMELIAKAAALLGVHIKNDGIANKKEGDSD